MTKIAVNGANGKMGQRILALAKESGEFDIVGRFDQNEAEKLSAEALQKKGKGVLIDFSSPEGTALAIEAARNSGWGLVIGTTGLDDDIKEKLSKASYEIPVVWSSNMSIGINVMLSLLDLASKKLPTNFNVDMTEAHHIHKKDRPSGTALMLARQVADSRGVDYAELSKMVEVIREGEIVGDHSVKFESDEEIVEIKHHAKTRDVFARGALTAAKFAASAKHGSIYRMHDVLSK